VAEQGRAQALAGGAAGVGGREGAAAAQTKAAAADDGTGMLLSLGDAAGILGPPCICSDPTPASHPGCHQCQTLQPAGMGTSAG